ncbi:MAG: polyphosphate polymerase domain-containing protein [Ruminiclostridium sp.]
MAFRHELKHEINYSDMIALRQRLSAVTKPDPHSDNGKYFIRSLYFDTPQDTALKEKLDGISRREKFRIRYYNGDTSYIRLERKSKLDGLCSKESEVITAEQAEKILLGEIPAADEKKPLLSELSAKMRLTGLKPKAVVDYTREAFIYPAGNVRVTLDYDIRTGYSCRDFLSADCVTLPASCAIILEVKWDEFLPSVIRDAVQLSGRNTGAFSKYAACRIYG